MAQEIKEIETAEPRDPATMTDREMLEEIYSFISAMHGMAKETAPMLEKLGKSSMGKMLGLR